MRNLSAKDGLKARMIRLKWVWGWSGRKIAHEVGICKTDVYEQIDLAEMALQGMLWGGAGGMITQWPGFFMCSLVEIAQFKGDLSDNMSYNCPLFVIFPGGAYV